MIARERVVRRRAGDRRDRPARGARRARRGPDLAARRARLHGRPGGRLRARAPPAAVVVSHMGQATAEITISRPGHAHPRAADAEGDAAPAARGGEGGRRRSEHGRRSWPPSSTRGSAPRRTSSASCTAATSTTASRPPPASSARAAGRPATRSSAVEAEYRALLDDVAAETGCTIDLDLRLVRGPYAIETDHPLLLALEAAYREVTGAELERSGSRPSPTARSSPPPGSRPSTTARSARARTRTSSTSRSRSSSGPRRSTSRCCGGSWCEPAGPDAVAGASRERHPNLLAIGGHPSVDMPPHVVEAAAQAAERAAYAPTRGLPAAARGDRRPDRGRARAAGRSRAGGAGHARRHAGALPGGAGVRRPDGHACPVVLLPADRRRDRRDLRRDRRRRRPARLGGIRGRARARRRPSRS